MLKHAINNPQCLSCPVSRFCISTEKFYNHLSNFITLSEKFNKGGATGRGTCLIIDNSPRVARWLSVFVAMYVDVLFLVYVSPANAIPVHFQYQLMTLAGPYAKMHAVF